MIVAPFDGLRAGESRAVPLDVFVVGHLEKLPTANETSWPENSLHASAQNANRQV